ncbi:uncharacterized protein F5147DRAFT_717870 [Suillus discolor]|uniref:Uncharacterized protein n=1 Tax=Suillus discolor TaxID=1912936 RepID=A0A9P7EY83_9AGAM|nr:uncharacterized protein F5147DRAFT_717870 [Suillus discolor]KAG2095701.1 hypothetical protein F5147DRAFT_717870 [Suillus discolor]
MPKSTTSKSTAARPPYKVRSAGTKRGIPLYSSEDSTPVPAQANSTTEEQPEELEVKVRKYFSVENIDLNMDLQISRLQSVEKDVPDKAGDELLPNTSSDGDAGANAAKPTPRGKEPLQEAKRVPVRATERGSAGQSQLEVCEQDYEITTTCECDCDDGWVYDEQYEKWIEKEIEERAAEAGMSTDDWIAQEYGDDDWYPYELEQGTFDGMSNDDAEAKMAQIFRRYRQ